MPDTRKTLERRPEPDTAALRSRTFDDDIDLTRFMWAIARRWAIVAAATLLGGALAFALASRAAVRYEASATLALIPVQASDAGLPVNAATVRALVTSTGLVAQVLRDTGVGDAPARFAAEAISVDEVPNTRFVRLRVRAPDPGLAASVAGRLVERATARGTVVDRGAADELSRQLDGQVARAAERLAEAEGRLLAYLRGHPLEPLRRQVDTLLQTQRESARPSQPSRGSARQDSLAPTGGVLQHELEFARLVTEYGAVKRVYAGLVERREGAAASASGGGPVAKLLDPEIAPGSSLPRDRVRTTAVGLLAGLLVGIALAVAVEARRGWGPPGR